MIIQDVFLDEAMDMPCLCSCGQWFDLNDGKSSLVNPNQIICPTCRKEEENLQVKVSDLKCHDKFTYQLSVYEVKRKFISENQPLKATEVGMPDNHSFKIELNEPDILVIKML